MNILFVHQNFPGQYVHIVRRLSRIGAHNIVGLGINEIDPLKEVPDDVAYFRYPLSQGNGAGVHPLARETETKVIRAEGVHTCTCLLYTSPSPRD